MDTRTSSRLKSAREDRPPSSKRNGQSQLFVEDAGRLLTYGFQVER
jgi:hypothetical protein